LTQKDKILKAAAKLFRKQSYSATSMQDIADELSIKASSLYNHISSKQEILSELLLSNAEAFVKGMNDIKEAELPPIDKLKRIISIHVRLTVEDTNKMSLMTNEWKLLTAENKEIYLAHRSAYEKNLKSILEEAIQVGEIKDVNIDLSLFSILSTLRWLYTWYDRNRNISPIDLEIILYKNLIEGIVAK